MILRISNFIVGENVAGYRVSAGDGAFPISHSDAFSVLPFLFSPPLIFFCFASPSHRRRIAVASPSHRRRIAVASLSHCCRFAAVAFAEGSIVGRNPRRIPATRWNPEGRILMLELAVSPCCSCLILLRNIRLLGGGGRKEKVA